MFRHAQAEMDFAAELSASKKLANRKKISVEDVTMNQAYNIMQHEKLSFLKRGRAANTTEDIAAFPVDLLMLLVIKPPLDASEADKIQLDPAEEFLGSLSEPILPSHLRTAFICSEDALLESATTKKNETGTVTAVKRQKDIILALASAPKHFSRLYVVSTPFTDIKRDYPFLFSSVVSSTPGIQSLDLLPNQLLPFEIVPRKLYLTTEYALLVTRSATPRVLNIGGILDVSQRPLIDPADLPGVDQRYTHLRPDPRFWTENEAANQQLVVLRQYAAAAKIIGKLLDQGKPVLVTSSDGADIAAAAAVAFFMKERTWSSHKAVAFLMSRKIPVPWRGQQFLSLPTSPIKIIDEVPNETCA